jgi:RNA polymerase-interacting CarD/CdnL/TRCF family regulator
MVKVGDLVVHPRYGAAVVENLRTMKYGGKKKRFFCLRLASDKDKSVVMISEEAIDDVGLRTKLLTAKTIRTIMRETPIDLDEDTQSRQGYIKTQMKSDDPHDLVSLLRDIYWRDQDNRLSQSETKTRNALLDTIESELAVSQGVNSSVAHSALQEIINRAMDFHLATLQPAEVGD